MKKIKTSLICSLFILVAYPLNSFSAPLPNNSVGTKQIKNNAVTTAKIKNGSITAAKVATDALTGAQINESTLGEVPLATNANQLGGIAASLLDDAANIVKIGTFSLTNGQSQTLINYGTLSLTAKCTINSGGNDLAEVVVVTSADHASLDAADTLADLLVATPEANRLFAGVTAATGTLSVDSESDGAVIDPTGKTITGFITTGVNIINKPGQCTFAGLLYLS